MTHHPADLHQAMLDSAIDAIIGMDAQGRVTEFNPAAEWMFGYKKDAVMGRALADIIVPEQHREAHRRGIARYVASGEAVLLGKRIEITAVRRDGAEFPVELSVQRIGTTEPPIFTGFIRDLSDRLQLETRLQQSQRMEAVGQLAGGVAHDFNNILTVIQGHAALLLEHAARPAEVTASAHDIADAAERAARLTRQLLAFSRRQVLQRVDVDINAIVTEMRGMIAMLGEDVTVRIKPGESVPLVNVDVSMLEQVVLNLAVNARDAMAANGGELCISTSVEDVTTATAQSHPDAVPGRFVRLRVEDTGTGIPPEQICRIFEPFYSTKDVDRGTGLGLATVYGIVRQHGGWIAVRSTLGIGTTFDIYFPAKEASTSSASARTGVTRTMPAGAHRGSGRVLLIEDEPAVRALVRLVLERGGYTVFEAATGASALIIWRAQRDEIDLVLTDMVMPGGVSGRDVARHVRSERPRTPVIISSGYSVETAGKDAPDDPCISFLQKPYRPEELLDSVRLALGTRRI